MADPPCPHPQAARSIVTVIEALDNSMSERAVETVKQMCAAEWFPARVSVCNLFAPLHDKCSDDDKQALRTCVCAAAAACAPG